MPKKINANNSKDRNLKVIAVLVVFIAIILAIYLYQGKTGIAADAHKEGQNSTPQSQLKTPQPKCGDDICDKGETTQNCVQDCPPELSKEDTARAIADDYFHHLYCVNNYNSSNLSEESFEKLSDEGYGKYKFVYTFNVDSPLLPQAIKLMRAEIIVSNNAVISGNVTKIYTPGDFFCGRSTLGNCTSDSECVQGGCSKQICQAASEPLNATSTCEYKDCYKAQNYGLSCRCVSDKCLWTK